MPNVASFEVDHRIMVAPFVRLSKSLEIPSDSHEVMVFDIRLRTPNKEEPMPPKAIHSLEHLLAGEIRDALAVLNKDVYVVDISPMGCRTGFYLSLVAPKGKTDTVSDNVAKAFKKTCDNVIKMNEIPAANEIQCGTASEHDLVGAKSICAYILQTVGELPIQDNEPLLLNK